MKKSVCIISLVTAISMLSVPFSNATVGGDDYQPSLSFRPKGTDEIKILRNGSVYVNTSVLNDQNNSFDTEVYIYDEMKQAGHIIAKWKCDSEYIKLTDLKDPITLCGNSPYSEFKTAKSIATTEHPELNRQYLSYTLGILSTDPFELTGENSYDYPIAGFSAVVNNETPAGKYAIEFMSGESGAQCEILYKYKDSNDFKEFMPAGEYAKPININVSDRMLGDINNDGKITGSDATMALQQYTYLSSGKQGDFTTEQTLAADLNDDGILTGTDATWLLQYYTMISSGYEDSIYDFLAE